MRLVKLSRLPLLFSFIGSLSVQSFGIEATTNPVGVIQISALGESDTLVSIPLKQPAVFNGVVDGTSGVELTAAGSPGWTADEWADSFYAFVRTGASAGMYATIDGNTASSISLDVDDLAAVVQGDSFSIHPYWTLSLLFPQGAGVHESSSHVERNTEIFIPGFGEGINLGADATYYLLDGDWYKVGAPLTETFNDAILLPDSYFVLRNNIATNTTVTFTGEVVMGDLGLPLIYQDQSEQDNIVGLQRPIEMSLDESGLASSGAFNAGDQLLVWDNAVAAQNRLLSTATVYTWDGAKWIKDGVDADAGADLVFTPGRGFIIRKAVGANVNQDNWVNAPNYGN